MPNPICLNSDYSTTRLVFNNQPRRDIDDDEELEDILCLTQGKERKGEGGLRTEGYFKKTLSDKPLISIVTAVFNGEEYLEKTIQSVINQTYDNVEYIVIDGGSSDKTLEILRSYEATIDYWVSENDRGMYDAIHKGFSLCRGNILAWLNADDIYYPYALTMVSNVFARHSVEWITGVASLIDSNGAIVDVEPPKCYFRFFIQRGYYRNDCLGFIQQESTFFSRSLYLKHPLDTALRMAGDYQLWSQFAKSSVLYTVRTILASFRVHSQQQTVQLNEYNRECNKISPGRKFKILKYILKPLALLGIPRIQLIKPIFWDEDFIRRRSQL